MDNIKRIIREFITEKERKILLGEGLIVTRDPYMVTNTINKWYSKSVIVKNHKTEDGSLGVIELTFKKRDKETVEKFNNLMNNYGYFPSTWFRGDNEETFNDINNIDYNQLYQIRYEPKFDVLYVPQERYLYHVTDHKHLDKIMKIGLTPRTKSKVSYHPERIYLSTDIESLNEIGDMMVYDGHIDDMVTLRIDTYGIKIPFMLDGQFYGGVYTTYNIPPSHIKVI